MGAEAAKLAVSAASSNVARENIVRAKLATGLGIYLILTIVPLLIYLVLGRDAGNARQPVFLAVSLPSIARGLLIGVVLYLAPFSAEFNSALVRIAIDSVRCHGPGF